MTAAEELALRCAAGIATSRSIFICFDVKAGKRKNSGSGRGVAANNNRRRLVMAVGERGGMDGGRRKADNGKWAARGGETLRCDASCVPGCCPVAALPTFAIFSRRAALRASRYCALHALRAAAPPRTVIDRSVDGQTAVSPLSAPSSSAPLAPLPRITADAFCAYVCTSRFPLAAAYGGRRQHNRQQKYA